MNDYQAEDILRRYQELSTARSGRESLWREIATHVQPLEQGQGRPDRQLFDATAANAAHHLSAGLWSACTHAGGDWFDLRARHAPLNDCHEVKLWLAEVTRRIKAVFAGDGLRFYARAMDLYADLVAYGTGVFYVAEEAGRIRFSCRPLSECVIAEDEQERVDTLFRRFQLTARQAYQRWGDAVGPAVMSALKAKRPDTRLDFLHAVFPNPERQPGRMDGAAMPWRSVYVSVQDKHVIMQGGYQEFPFMVPRWSTRSGAVYGDSPAMLALPDIKMLNAMCKTTLVAAQKAVDPPLLAPDEAAMSGVRTTPGGIIYGGIDAQGRRLYEPLQSGGSVALGLEMEEQRRRAIREAFFHSLLQLTGAPVMTATEVLARQEDKVRLLGAHLGRLQSEFLDPLIRRVFGLMESGGRLPSPPAILLEQPGLRVIFTTALAQAEKAGAGGAILRGLETLMPIMAAQPEIMDNFDGDAMARAVAEAHGMPPELMRSPDEVMFLRWPVADWQSGTGAAMTLSGEEK